MEKARISITVDPAVLAEIDEAAAAAGLARSAWLEKVSHEAHLRAWIARYNPQGGVEQVPAEVADRAAAMREFWHSGDAR